MPRLVQALQVVGPEQGLLFPQVVEIAPVIQARVMTVVVNYLDGIRAHWNNVRDIHILLLQLQFCALSPVPSYLGRGRVDPQELSRVVPGLAILKADFEFMRLLMEHDVCRFDGHVSQDY